MGMFGILSTLVGRHAYAILCRYEAAIPINLANLGCKHINLQYLISKGAL